MELFDLTPILKAVLTFCITMVTLVVLPLLNQKLGRARTETLLTWVGVFVNAAEQIFRGTGMGEAKKAYVLQMLNEKGYDVELDEIDALIEAAVLELKREYGVLITDPEVGANG